VLAPPSFLGGSSNPFSSLVTGLLGQFGSLGSIGSFGSFGLAGDRAVTHDFNLPSPTTTPVVITPGATTLVLVNGQPHGAVSAGDKFLALYSGSPTDSIQALTAGTPLAIFDHTPPKPKQLYAFVGTVTGVDTTAGTVTVKVSNSLPSTLVPAGSPAVPFTVGSDTLVLGGSNAGGLFGGSLGNVSPGDIVAGGLVAPEGDTLAQVEALPLKILLDIPVPTTSTGTTTMTARAKARAKALKEALSLLEGKKVARGKSHSHKHSGKHHSTRA
jgi:hypothetical protein